MGFYYYYYCYYFYYYYYDCYYYCEDPSQQDRQLQGCPVAYSFVRHWTLLLLLLLLLLLRYATSDVAGAELLCNLGG